jgi:energy-coupling factor transporter ATP-binding protein EcfA2
MLAYIIVGSTGSGKTTCVVDFLNIIKNRQKHIFDVNAEPVYMNCKLYKDGDFSKFVEEMNKVKNSVIVFEEATIFFSNWKLSENVLKILVQKRHKNNLIFFVFHSLRTVPVSITDFCDVLILFKTLDRETLVKSKYKNDPKIIVAYEKAQKLPKYGKVIINMRE